MVIKGFFSIKCGHDEEKLHCQCVVGYRFVTNKCRNLETLFAFSLASYAAYFAFHTGVHENHLFIPTFLTIILYTLSDRWFWPMLVVATMQSLNLYLFYGLSGRAEISRVLFDSFDLSILPAAAAPVIFGWLFVEVLKIDTNAHAQNVKT